jgi:hypothetical protein
MENTKFKSSLLIGSIKTVYKRYVMLSSARENISQEGRYVLHDK